MSDDRAAEAAARMVNGTTWSEFCDTLKMAGSVITREGSPPDPFTRAEGFRYLSRITRAALETFVENADPLAPVLGRVVHETVKMGADNPDNRYYNAAISGEHDYRLWGNRGTVHYLGFGTQRGGYGEGAGMPPTGYLEAKEMQVAPDGSFEITLSQQEQAGNWLPMTAETGTLIVRQTFLDREREVPAELHLERIGAAGQPSELSPAAVDGALQKSARLVGGAAAIFAGWAEGFQSHVNELPPFDQELSRAYGGDPNIFYYHSYWKLRPEQALVIEVTPPACEYWNFQLNNHWMESLDYRYFRIHLNKHTAAYEPDGSVRVVVAHDDPGLPNWIQTAGHGQGTMCWRWVRADAHPQPRTRVVELSDI
ncbi:MAG: DUF1214 domain-containing protein [Deltaproteobacteria bacterium]|jgi:hypothetical protein|nr:DUF1214 domain-containing protein [Deltaproteobacteria bacterium]MBW2533211.1 DUF1214 domain-containing protein [Deltaproteobacteria bacterium]